MVYRITISTVAQKQFLKLPLAEQDRVETKVQALATTPRPNGVTKLKGSRNEYRIRVGDYRIRYEIDDSQTTIKVVRCLHRKDVYRDKG